MRRRRQNNTTITVNNPPLTNLGAPARAKFWNQVVVDKPRFGGAYFCKELTCEKKSCGAWCFRALAKRFRDAYFCRMYEFCIPAKSTAVPDGDSWLHEIKYDGYRLRLERDGDRVRLITSGGYNWTKRYPWIVESAPKNRMK